MKTPIDLRRPTLARSLGGRTRAQLDAGMLFPLSLVFYPIFCCPLALLAPRPGPLTLFRLFLTYPHSHRGRGRRIGNVSL